MTDMVTLQWHPLIDCNTTATKGSCSSQHFFKHSLMDSEASGTPSSPSALQRGKACIPCRRRKMRCDGQKPFCGPCVRTNRSEDCEYADSQGRSRTQQLEENIARLESRIHELEFPDENPSTVALHDPYASREESPDQGILLARPRERPTSTSSAGSTGSSAGYHDASLRESPVSALQNADSWWNRDEPPLHIMKQLADHLLSNASQFGFFLNIPLFRSSFVLPFPLGHPSRPSPALLSAVYLWGLHLSRSNTLREHESDFLSRALRCASNALSGTHPQKFLHALQAEILLAYYFFRNGRFLEGKYHCSAAASLAISGGLNKIRSGRTPSPTVDFVRTRCPALPPPRDAVDEGERINGFWAALILDKCWSVALGSPSNFTDDETLGTRVDTPWPLDYSVYEQGFLLPNVLSSSTVHDFISGTLDLEEGGFSALAMEAQAALLFHRATQIAAQWKTDIQPLEAAAFRADFLALDQLVDKFREHSTPMDQFRGLASLGTRDILVTHCLAYGATIQLHKNFASRNANSNQKCLDAASAVVVILNRANLSDIVYLNPIIGTLWMAVCRVFIAEVLRLRTLRSSWTSEFPVRNEAQLIASIQSVMTTMAMFGRNCPITSYQLSQVRDAYAAI